VWWIMVALLVCAAVGLAVAAFRRETASATALDARAGEYLTGGFAFAALAFVIVLSKLV
jgi:LPS O-antigen subunit length determinant protein (WzzB/FepE family)